MSNRNLDIPQCIDIIRKIENEYKDWTTVALIDNIRHTSSLDSLFFQVLLGSNVGVSIFPKGKLTKSNIDDLKDTLSHELTDDAEYGISLDISTDRSTTLGHVLTGISAALYHDKPNKNQKIQPLRLTGFKITVPIVNYDITSFGPEIPMPGNFGYVAQSINIDSLYAATITGDLGQTATKPEYLYTPDNYPYSTGGIGTEATSAELYGDIDGFLLGAWLRGKGKGQLARANMRLPMTNPNNIKLSTLLGEYYRTILPKDRKLNMNIEFINSKTQSIINSSLEGIRRFTNFGTLLRNPKFRYNFYLQTVGFQYYYSISKKDISLIAKQDASSACYRFERWCSDEIKRIKNGIALSLSTGSPLSDCIDNFEELTFLDPDSSFICSIDDGDELNPDQYTVFADLGEYNYLSNEVFNV
jgi:hypothetical protein